MPNSKLRHKHRAAHPDVDPSDVPSLSLPPPTLNVQTHTRFKLKFEIGTEPEPMELPECKAGNDWQVQNREQKEGKKGAQMWAGRYVQTWRPLMLSLRNQVWWRAEVVTVCSAAQVPTWSNQAPCSQGRGLCGTAKGKQCEDTARGAIDDPWETDQMWISVRDVEEKVVMCAGEDQPLEGLSIRPGLMLQDRIF